MIPAIRRVYRLGFLLAALLLCSGCSEWSQKTVICDMEPFNAYDEIIPQILPEHSIHFEYKGAFQGLQQGAAVVAYDVLGIPALELGVASYWYPQIHATAVIAVDRNFTEAAILGWNDLLTTPETISISDRVPEVQLLMAALSYGLEGKNYSLDKSAALLAALYEEERLVFNDYSKPILICFDHQVATLNNIGCSLEIIVPQEGTLTFAKGLLSQEPLILAADTDSILLDAGFRLPNGKSRPYTYPEADSYTKAALSDDYAHLASICADVTYVLKHDVQKIRSYLYSSADGRNHQFFALVFIILVILWIGFVLRRTMQKGVRRAAFLAALLVIGWVLLRMFKYQIPLGVLNQYCWYGYYLFQLGIALVILWMAWVVDQPEEVLSPPHWWLICAVWNGLLFLLIMTNNVHHMAFIFLPNDPAYSINYTYGPLYYVTMATIFLQVFAAQVLFIRKSWKSPRRMVFLIPILFYGLLALYGICYVLRVPLVWGTDLTVVSGIFIVVFIEACIRAGLIPVNTNYKDLFEHSPLKMQIIARSGKVVMSSKAAFPMSPVEKISPQPSLPNKPADTLFYQGRINGGTVIWQENISSINRLHKEIADSITKLNTVNAMLIEEEKIKSRLAAIEARTALFTELEGEINKKTVQLAEMIKTYLQDDGGQSEVAAITLLLCYIKRRCILFFCERETADMALDEITAYLDELGEFAAFAGINMHVSAVMNKQLSTRRATLFYDCVYTQLEWAVKCSCRSMLVQIVQEQDTLILKILQAEYRPDFSMEESFLASIRAAGGKIIIKDMDEAMGIWLSFPAGGDSYA